MLTPTFAKTHNLVSFLEKPSESEGFEKIIDFLNAKPIRYALTVNPTVYALCVKTILDCSKCEKGTTCLPNDTIFAELARIGQGYGISGNVTLLFEAMMVNAQEEVGKGSAEAHSPSSEIPIKESILTPSKDQLPSGDDSIQLNDLMIFCTNLQQQERSIKDIDLDANTALVDESQRRMHDADIFGVDELEGNKVFVDVIEQIIEKEVSIVDSVTTVGEVVTAASVEDGVAPTTATTADVDNELTLEKTLIAIKVAKPKVISTVITTPRAKGIVFHKQVQVHKPTVSSSKDKGKTKMIEPEKPLKKKDQIALDKEMARKLEAKIRAEIKEEERIAWEKDEANRAMIEE
nr:hypothetical protein [Tanacetum cinerariifolium]